MRKMISIALFLVVFTGCNQQQDVDTKSEGEKLMQTSREWSQASASRNADSVLNYWSDDAVVYSAGEQPMKGKQAIRQMVEAGFKNPTFKIRWEPLSAEISKSGDLGYLLENTTMTYDDSAGKTSEMNFNAVTIWKKQANGEWKCVVDVLSPAAGQQGQ